MPAAPLRVPAGQPPFAAAFARVREELDVPASFPPEVEAEAEVLAARGPVLPPGAPATDRVDARDIPFVAVDPPGSRDLDQAFHAERRGSGYRVRYAIADVAAFVHPGTAVDRESFQRGVTLYLPDGRAPLHPDALGEGAASLLPGVERPALLWTIDLDAAGGEEGATLRRATVRSRAALGYPEVQARIDAGTAEEPLVLLREVGTRLREREVDRGGVSLDLPTQEVVDAGGGGYALRYERPLAVEQWNEQISLLAGMAAAAVMIEAGAGLLRTLPPPAPEVLHRLERTARALGVAWPTGATWGEVVRGLDRSRADDAAFLVQATHALRGAGYTVVGPGGATTPAELVHAAVAAPYAHVTAPLRRLADRYVIEAAVAVAGGRPVDERVEAAFTELPKVMARAESVANRADRAVIELAEAVIMAGREHEVFDAVVVDEDRHGTLVQLVDPAVLAHVHAHRVDPGDRLRVRLHAVDVVARTIELHRVE